MQQQKDSASFRRRGDLGIPFVIGIFALATALGWIVFRNYTRSTVEITSSLAEMQTLAPSLDIEGCAEKTMEWYKNCQSMAQLCDDTVPRMMKVCLTNNDISPALRTNLEDKSAYCAPYGDEVFGYNFGVVQCAPYLHDRRQKKYKKACADIWQSVADFCKAAAKANKQERT